MCRPTKHHLHTRQYEHLSQTHTTLPYTDYLGVTQISVTLSAKGGTAVDESLYRYHIAVLNALNAACVSGAVSYFDRIFPSGAVRPPREEDCAEGTCEVNRQSIRSQ